MNWRGDRPPAQTSRCGTNLPAASSFGQNLHRFHRRRIAVLKTDLQVLVDIADLSHGASKDFYELNTSANSGRLPVAGPMIVLCFAVAVARVDIAGKDLDKNVKQTAAKIAAEVVTRTGCDPRQKT